MESKKSIKEQKGQGGTKRVKRTEKVVYLAGEQITTSRNGADL